MAGTGELMGSKYLHIKGSLHLLMLAVTECDGNRRRNSLCIRSRHLRFRRQKSWTRLGRHLWQLGGWSLGEPLGGGSLLCWESEPGQCVQGEGTS